MPRDLVRAGRHLLQALVNRLAKWYRRADRQSRRAVKQVGTAGRQARAAVRREVHAGRGVVRGQYRLAVRATRAAQRTQQRVWPRIQADVRASRALRHAAAGEGPIIVGPWLSEVGYEVLYWVPFLRWFRERYRVDPARLVVVSRGGAGAWYQDVAGRYVELLDIYTPAEFAALNAARYAAGDQKQHAVSAFDEQILARVRQQPGLAGARLCHPSVMFRLLRQFWLGNESLEYLQDHLRFAAVAPPALDLPRLPERFTAVKFYTGAALPDTAANRAALRGLIRRLAAAGPVVTLDIGLALDEHEDYRFTDLPNVVSVAEWLTPATNLAVQTEVIRRADRFVGTCGSLAWLAPMLGVPTVAVYAADDFLGPHLYAARAAYRAMRAAPFTPVDLGGLTQLGLSDPPSPRG